MLTDKLKVVVLLVMEHKVTMVVRVLVVVALTYTVAVAVAAHVLVLAVHHLSVVTAKVVKVCQVVLLGQQLIMQAAVAVAHSTVQVARVDVVAVVMELLVLVILAVHTLGVEVVADMDAVEQAALG
jgi:hypothetical protein